MVVRGLLRQLRVLLVVAQVVVVVEVVVDILDVALMEVLEEAVVAECLVTRKEKMIVRVEELSE